MIQVDISAAIGVLVILTGIASAYVQVIENDGHQMEDNHGVKLIGAELGDIKLNVEMNFPGVPMVALRMVLLIVSVFTSRGA
jgi:hypothetical protein